MLAFHVILDQGIAVKAVNFSTPFFAPPVRITAPGMNKFAKDGLLPSVLIYAREHGCEVEVVDLSDGYLDMLHNPRYGYGRNVNPCIDCHILMFRTAKLMMEADEVDFVFTGEVVGQRPKSQRMGELKLIARASGLEDRILRPLSAQLMEPTLPEREGWVDRSRLLSFRGRSRKPQMELAERFGIKEYPTPAGGCILTEPSYANKVRDLWKHSDMSELDWDDYDLLRVGRHLRISPNLKVIVGRNEAECMILEGFRTGRKSIQLADITGPLLLIDDYPDPLHEVIAARICVRYSRVRNSESEVPVQIECDGEAKTIEVKPFKPEEVEGWVIT